MRKQHFYHFALSSCASVLIGPGNSPRDIASRFMHAPGHLASGRVGTAPFLEGTHRAIRLAGAVINRIRPGDSTASLFEVAPTTQQLFAARTHVTVVLIIKDKVGARERTV